MRYRVYGCLLLIFVISIGKKVTAQSILSDAVTLTLCLDTQEAAEDIGTTFAFRDYEDTLSYVSVQQCEALLWKYTGLEAGSGRFLSDEYRGNPFISESEDAIIYLPSTLQTPGLLATIGMMNRPDRKEAISGGGGRASSGFVVTDIADGFAKFLAKRMKQELTLTFFIRLQQTLIKNKSIGSLFPQTTGLLELIDQEVYNFDSYIGALRESFIKDLKVLPQNTDDWLLNSNFVKKPEKLMLASDVLNVGQRLIDGESAVSVINFLATDALVQDTSRLAQIKDTAWVERFERLAANLRLVNLLSNSLLVDETGDSWHDPSFVTEKLKDPKILYIYLGLLYQQSPEVGQIRGKTLSELLRPLAVKTNEVTKLRYELQQIAADAKRIKEAVVEIKKVPWDSVAYEVFYNVFQGFFGVLESGVRFQTNFIPGLETAGDIEGKMLERVFVDLLQDINELSLNVRRKQYVPAVNNLATIVSTITDKEYPLLKELVRYGNFMASVAEANNSDEVAMIVELFAMPPGGSSLKKHSTFSVSANAYTGGGFGWERLEELGTKTMLSFSAPVGIAFNKGFGDAGSLTVFTSIFDIGALTAFRLNDNTTNDLPALEWSNIVAPGGYLLYGFGNNVPISFGFGAQRGPNLRKVNDDVTLQIEEASGWRVMFLLDVDIPLFHLYTR